MPSASPDVGRTIRELRIAHGLTQAELAADIGARQQTVAKWESGTNLPRLPELVALARRFRVSTDQLLGLDRLPDAPRVEAALVADRAITDDSRRQLLVAYRAAVNLGTP